MPVAFESPTKPGVGDISSGEDNLAVTLADKVTRGTEHTVEVIKAYLIELLLVAHSHHVVTEGHEGHMDGFDLAEQIRINGPRQNESVNQAMLLKNGRQVDPVRRRSRGIMQSGEQHVLFQAAGIRFDALQDASMKGMEKIAVAQQKADHFCAPLENPAGLGIGAEPQTPDGLEYPLTRFPAHLRAGIEHPGNRSNAHGSGLRHFANGRFSWNYFHNTMVSCRFGLSPAAARNRPPHPSASLSHQNSGGILSMIAGCARLCQEVGKPIQPIGFTRF